MSEMNDKDIKWERKLLEKIAMSTIVEQRKARRWQVFIRLAMIGLACLYILPFLLIAMPLVSEKGSLAKASGEHIGVVDVYGPIAHQSQASATTIVTGLRNAIESENSIAVIVRINSPGGSPVQSDLVYKEILRLRELHPEKPVYAVIEDIGASGAYYIASAAEKIYASQSSIVGSIGVTSGGSFGFVDAMEKLGIERRIYTSGENKAFLDPFQPEKTSDVDRYEAMLENVHKQFIEAVENGRGTRLNTGENVFNGYIWTGQESLDLGLIDAYGSAGSIGRDEFETSDFVNYTPRQDLFTQFADRIGASAARTLVEILAPAPSFR